VAHGDLGRSIRAQQPVRDLIVEKLPATLLLTTSAAVIALLIAFPAGIVAAVKRNTLVDLLAMVGALLGVSIPSFWSGIMLIMIFALTRGCRRSATPHHDSPGAALRYLICPR
jgi:peptide/nickel transport system permease protein